MTNEGPKARSDRKPGGVKHLPLGTWHHPSAARHFPWAHGCRTCASPGPFARVPWHVGLVRATVRAESAQRRRVCGAARQRRRGPVYLAGPGPRRRRRSPAAPTTSPLGAPEGRDARPTYERAQEVPRSPLPLKIPKNP